MKRTTVGLIGCGAVSKVLYVPALARLAAEGLVDCIALVDPNEKRRGDLQKRLGTATPFPHAGAMLAAITPDLAIIATPHHLHAELAVACLERGIAVLCEKPMATTVAECDAMIAAASRSNRPLAVGHFRRFFPSTRLVKAIVSEGVLGPVRSFSVQEGETFSWPAASGSFSTRDAAGGGVLIDAGAHTIDLLLWWLGDVAACRYEDDAMGGVEANCILRLEMEGGAKGLVQLSRDWPLPNRYVIECEKGWVAYIGDVVDRIEWGLRGRAEGLDSRIHALTGGAQRMLQGADGSGPKLSDCFLDQLRDVVDAIRADRPVQVPGIDGRKTVEVIERCYASRTLLEMPWLDPTEHEQAGRLANA